MLVARLARKALPALFAGRLAMLGMMTISCRGSSVYFYCLGPAETVNFLRHIRIAQKTVDRPSAAACGRPDALPNALRYAVVQGASHGEESRVEI